ncbi:hypothetical protein [Streptomyces sp. MBT84]|uniref:hypothetical protein n=1 Tax=Streptomyces sp. MBT84 TaxID=1488414 RepID=UPI001C6ED427|nr:hypothetical protein [Streptomyces sp. MBT84]
MTSSPARKPSPPATLEDAAVAVAVAVTAAQEVVHAARRDLVAAINTSRQAGEPIQRIAQRTGLDAVAVRNILAVAPAPTLHRSSSLLTVGTPPRYRCTRW